MQNIYPKSPSIVLACDACNYIVCATCAGCVTCHHRSAYGLNCNDVPLFIASKQDIDHSDSENLEEQKNKPLAKIVCQPEMPSFMSWNRSFGDVSFAAVAFDDCFQVLSFSELQNCELKDCETWKPEPNPSLGKILKFRWGVHRANEGQKEVSDMVCMCECSNGLFFFMFDSIGERQSQFELECESPVSDYGLLSPYVAFSEQYSPESCNIWCIENNALQPKTVYSKPDINISAIAFLPPMSEHSTWLSVGTTSGFILILTFSGDESPVCVYSFDQQLLGAVSMITSCPQITKTLQHSGQWRDLSDVSYYCATNEEEREDGQFVLCLHRAKGKSKNVNIIQDSHWSCCGNTSKVSACSNAADDQLNISFVTCFQSGICSCHVHYLMCFCMLTDSNFR
jgi:hypothetical protein